LTLRAEARVDEGSGVKNPLDTVDEDDDDRVLPVADTGRREAMAGVMGTSFLLLFMIDEKFVEAAVAIAEAAAAADDDDDAAGTGTVTADIDETEVDVDVDITDCCCCCCCINGCCA